jgi:alpha-tubulin suppressor-like RCC1 family protein
MPVPGSSQQVQFPTPPETGVQVGSLFTWGYADEGRLGNGAAPPGTNTSSPVQVGALSWQMVSCGGGSSINDGHGHMAAIRSDGLLFTWGANGDGQLGNGNTGTNQSSPVQIGASSWKFVSCGANNGHAIRVDGLLFGWGNNASGQIGDGTTTLRNSPVQIGASSWKVVAGCDQTTFGIDINGRLFAWGTGINGILGDGTSVSKSSPVQIGASSWTMVHAGRHVTSAIALRIDGLLFAWGSNTAGLLGVNSATVTFSSPVAIGASSWMMCAMTGIGGIAIRIDGLLFSWGSLPGDGTITSKSSPVQIGSSTWSKVYGGDSCKWMIRSDNALFVVGSGFADGTATLASSSPVQIGTSQWIQIDSGQNTAVSNLNTFSGGIKF